MDEVTCRIARPLTLSYQSTIERAIHKVRISTIFKPNEFQNAIFYVWHDDLSLDENNTKYSKEGEQSVVCLTQTSPNDQENQSNDSSNSKFHITIFKNSSIDQDSDSNNNNKSPTKECNFLSFLIDQDYMVNPSCVEITKQMGCPYHITLGVLSA